MKRVLVVIGKFKKGGGISQFVLEYYNAISVKKNIKIDILVEDGISKIDRKLFRKEIEFIEIADFKGNTLKYIQDWKSISKLIGEKYNFVHIHTDNFVRFFYLVFLKKNSNVIIHSHNSFNDEVMNSKVKKFMHHIGKNIVKKSNFYRFACSDLAAEWLFGNSKYIQINNGVDLDLFEFNPKVRENYLNKFNIHKKIVYGHIGRFVYQKNHEQLIDIFENIHYKNKNTVLLLIGEGEKREYIKQIVKEKGLLDVVIFLGQREDVNQLLNIIDYIIFPSLYEGLPISLVEAQANGITIFYSDVITKEVSLLPTSRSFSLSETSENISNKIVNAEYIETRKESKKILKKLGYDKVDVVNRLYDFYEEN